MANSSINAVVFGGAGFLGSHVADALSDAGYRVTIFDLKRSPYLRQDQIGIEGNILDPQAVERACAQAQYIFNFAGLADINEAENKPKQTAELNILGNINILEAARKAKDLKRFVFASTVYVYSESGSFYRASKQACENFIELYAKQYGVEYTILRYGSLYGRRADHRNTIFRFISSALKNKRIEYHGDGTELREYINVLDAAKATIQILADDYKNQNVVLTGPQLFPVKDVILMIKEMLEQRVETVFSSEVNHAHYKITPYTYRPKLGRKLLVNPFVDLGQGILDCIHEIDQQIASEDPNSLKLHIGQITH